MPHSITSLVVLSALAFTPAAVAHPHDDPSPTDFATQLSHSFRNAAEHIKPSVVRVGTAEAIPRSSKTVDATQFGFEIRHEMIGRQW